MNAESDLPVSVRIAIIQQQLDIARAILLKAQERQLLPEEKLAVSQLGQALAELTDAVRALLDEQG